MERGTVLEILRDACRAPSGDNAQPWRFEVRGDTIWVINMPEKDTSLFNWRQMTNHVALGATIENLRVSAEAKGFRTEINFFPDAPDRLIVAEAVLTPDASMRNDLAPYIAQRASNRKSYLPKKIEPEKLAQLAALAENESSRVSFISDEATVREVAHIVSAGEKLALENRSIRDFLFSHVTWTREEDEQKHGFFIDTFEFNPVQRAAFKLFRNWNALRFFLPLGISTMVAKDAEKVHRTSAAFGAVIAPGRSDEDFIRAGMLLERLWLAATQLGLALQPTTTVHFIGARVRGDDPGDISEQHQRLLDERYAMLAQKFGVSDLEEFGLVFRLGYADSPSAVTTRFEPNVTWLSRGN